MQYRMKAVVFDIQAECRALKDELQKTGILVLEPFFGLHIAETLLQETELYGIAAEECLFLTNRALHASAAKSCGMAVVGCMEGHFEVPKTQTLLESPEEVSVSYLDRVFCHEKGMPAIILETPRLVLKELAKEDMDALYEILTKEEVSRYLPAKAGTREEELEKLISYVSCAYSFFEYGYWGVFLKETGKLIGRAGFREGSYPPEVGYVIDSEQWGKGFGTEVLSHLLLYAGEEIDCTEVHARIQKENTVSIHVAEKCGFSVVAGAAGIELDNGMEQGIFLYRYIM